MLEFDESLRPYVSDWDVTGRQAQVRRCVGLIRELSRLLMHGGLASSELSQVERMLESVHALISASAADGASEELPDAEVHPWVGLSNSVAPPMRFHLEEDVLIGIVRCSEVQGGRAPRVHGGVVAGLIDAAVATRSALSGASMTAQLVIDYLHPVPLDEVIRIEANVERIEGRKCYAAARVYHGATLCAEARALMISPRAASPAAQNGSASLP
jgi:acyl-coenzyme A thioesterase PaaI-like protein